MNDRNETIQRIRKALKARSGKAWSVTGGRGTAWGWITVEAPPSRRTWAHRLKAGAIMDRPEDYEAYCCGESDRCMSPEDQAELAQLFGMDVRMCNQNVSIPASSDHYREYIERAEGRTPAKIAQDYWD